MTRQVSDFIERCRTRARAIKAKHEEMGSTIPLTHAYELLAASTGYRTWAAMRSAGEARATSSEPVAPLVTQEVDDLDLTAWVSLEISRRISLDSYDATGEFDVPAILKAAYAELSHYFFDGEEYPSMCFGRTHVSSDDIYTTTVDIEVPPGMNDLYAYVENGMRGATRDNVVGWRALPGGSDHDPDTVDAVFGGSGGRTRNLPWLEDRPKNRRD